MHIVANLHSALHQRVFIPKEYETDDTPENVTSRPEASMPAMRMTTEDECRRARNIPVHSQSDIMIVCEDEAENSRIKSRNSRIKTHLRSLRIYCIIRSRTYMDSLNVSSCEVYSQSFQK